MILCDKGGGILNFVISHFKNSVKAIIHVSRCKIAKYVTSHEVKGVSEMCDVIYGWPLI